MLEIALEHHRAGRLDEAEAIYRQILSAEPRHADCIHLLGMIQHERGRNDAAVRLIRLAIAMRPAEAAYHSNLGIVFQAAGQPHEAAACFERALALKPDWAELYTNLGNVLEASGRLEEAAANHEHALLLKPDLSEAHCNLGNAKQAQGKLNEAVACYERALQLKPDYPDAHNNLGNALAAEDRVEEAVAHYEGALALRPAWASAHNNLATALLAQDRIAEATSHYLRALALKPDYPSALNNLGNLYKEQGQFEQALAHFSRAIEIQPDYAEAHLSRALVKRFECGDPEIAALENLSRQAQLTADKMLYIYFALAKALDDIGEYHRAFEYLRKGNRLKRQKIAYDEERTLGLFHRVAAVFTPSLFHRFRRAGHPSPVPIFVVGMPRSGTTLVEQILAGHPEIHAAGELTILEKMELNGAFDAIGSLRYPESIPALDESSFQPLGEIYLSRLPLPDHDCRRVVDKLPGNFLRIGLIRLLLPNAKIIHLARHPLDTCFSSYSKLFTSGLDFTYDLEELGRYYRAYAHLMDHWRAVLPPGALLDVRYEDVVNDLEDEARRLIAYCGLPWDGRCIRFHETVRRVKTASAVQVRQPLFRGSIERWRRYEPALAPLIAALGSPGAGRKSNTEAQRAPFPGADHAKD